MQIPREKYEELSQEAESWKERCKRSEELNQRQYHQIQTFDEILNKIIRAAQGVPLIQDRDGYPTAMTSGYYNGQGEHHCQPPTTEEIQARMLDDQFARNGELQSRVAAVIAVAQFAKEHKA